MRARGSARDGRDRGSARAGATASIAAAALLAGAVVLLNGCQPKGGAPPPPPAGAIAPGTSIGSASIAGRVLLTQPPPERKKLSISEAGCHHADAPAEAFSETVVAAPDGALKNVIVHVVSGLGDRVFAPPPAATLDQKGCLYTPHVIAVQANQLVTFVNSDPTLHNVHAVTKVNPAFNVGMAVKGQKVSRFFSQTEIVKMKCDVHAWMQSWIGVFDNPFHAVSDDAGRFTIEGLPAGTYSIEAWQETYGVKTQSVTLSDGQHLDIGFSFP
jgi:carboxypeptidase family protein